MSVSNRVSGIGVSKGISEYPTGVPEMEGSKRFSEV